MMRIQNLSKRFGTEEVLRDFSLELVKDKVNVLIGPSGCGKTTLLRILSGLSAPDAGFLDQIPAQVSMVFQEDRLIPWATVEQNLLMAYPRILRYKNSSVKKVESLLDMTGLIKDRGKFPSELSGGMRKRAALARGFVPEAGLVLLDEPLQAIDWALKMSLVSSFYKIWSRKPVTVVFVTHDIQEAAMMGDVIHVLDSGPVTVRLTIENDLDPSMREMYGKGVVAIERKIFDTLLSRERRS